MKCSLPIHLKTKLPTSLQHHSGDRAATTRQGQDIKPMIGVGGWGESHCLLCAQFSFFLVQVRISACILFLVSAALRFPPPCQPSCLSGTWLPTSLIIYSLIGYCYSLREKEAAKWTEYRKQNTENRLSSLEWKGPSPFLSCWRVGCTGPTWPPLAHILLISDVLSLLENSIQRAFLWVWVQAMSHCVWCVWIILGRHLLLLKVLMTQGLTLSALP